MRQWLDRPPEAPGVKFQVVLPVKTGNLYLKDILDIALYIYIHVYILEYVCIYMYIYIYRRSLSLSLSLSLYSMWVLWARLTCLDYIAAFLYGPGSKELGL